MIRKYSPEFIKSLKKKDVRIRKSFKKKIAIFAKNPRDSKLRNHSLKGEYKGFRSIDISSDYRALYTEKNEGDEVIAYFEEIGTHDELYKNH